MKDKNERVITAKTFSPVYDEREDRIRLAVNYQDIYNRVDFMVTRSLILYLIPAVNGYMDKYYKDDLGEDPWAEEPIPQINDITKEKPGKQAKKDDLQPIKYTDTSDMDLLKTPDILLEKIDLRYNPGSKNTTFIFYAKDITVKSILDYITFKRVIQALKNSIPIFKWGISKSFLDEG